MRASYNHLLEQLVLPALAATFERRLATQHRQQIGQCRHVEAREDRSNVEMGRDIQYATEGFSPVASEDGRLIIRIASPRSAPEQFFRCLIRMFPAVATRHSVIAWKAAADEVVPNTIS
jgi:hypothetical protein